MSRVDEAMRRAAELTPGTPDAEARTGPNELSPIVGDDVAALASESFPIEMPDRRAPRQGVHTPFATMAVAPPKPPSAPAHAAPETPAKHVSLVERIDSRFAAKVVVDRNIMPTSREQYRRLGAALHHAQSDHGIKVVMIASALAGEGKTLTASNLALTFSESYQRSVLLIDADLRKPSLHMLFGLDDDSGLSEGLAAAEERKLPVRQVSERLAILTAGRASSDPMAGLTSGRMRRLIDESRKLFDWIILDTSPLGFLSDADLLSAMVDTAVIVVKAGTTSYDLVNRAVEALGRERVFGVVLNRAETPPAGSSFGYYDRYYSDAPYPGPTTV